MVAGCAGLCLGAAAPATGTHGLGDLSIEELMNITVTSVSKREQKLDDVASAVSVLTNDDLRRSGVTTLPDALRLVPGTQVASVDASTPAVSVRGFNGVYANKLLVLVDGRTVYTPLWAGVVWSMQQPMLEDIDRIEIIKGPGASVWGANAVNGVINVVGRNARDTQGTVVYAGGGDVHKFMGGARYGGKLAGETYYRVFVTRGSEAAYRHADGRSVRDEWSTWHGGFRVDSFPAEHTRATWQADLTTMDFDAGASDAYNVNTLGRWQHELPNRSRLELQAYYDRSHIDGSSTSRSTIDTFDVSLQQTFDGDRHKVIWGAGIRGTRDRLGQTTPLILVREQEVRSRLVNVFLQDDFAAVPDRLIFTAGLKLEHTSITGLEFQPTLRALFKPAGHHVLWAAVSRAIRSPSDLEARDIFGFIAGAPLQGPDGGFYLPQVVGNRDLKAEVMWAYELGYRAQPSRNVSLELASFYNDYRGLVGLRDLRFVPGVPLGAAEFPFMNLFPAETYGGEASLSWAPTDDWRIIASYSALVLHARPPAGAIASVLPNDDPRQQACLRSSHDLTPRASLDVQLRAVDSNATVPSYVTADVRLGCRFTDELELSLVGQNLLEPQHLEHPGELNDLPVQVPRGFHVKLTWRY